MKRRTASDRMAECIIEMVHEYKQTIEHLNSRIKILDANVDYWKHRTENAVNDCDKATDTLGEVADIIASVTAHHEDGDISIYLSNIPSQGDRKRKIERLFELLDIPMTAEQIKDGDIVD